MIDKNLKVLDLADGVEKLANISSFDVNSTISDSDLMLIEQSTALKKVTIGDLKTEFGTQTGTPDTLAYFDSAGNLASNSNLSYDETYNTGEGRLEVNFQQVNNILQVKSNLLIGLDIDDNPFNGTFEIYNSNANYVSVNMVEDATENLELRLFNNKSLIEDGDFLVYKQDNSAFSVDNISNYVSGEVGNYNVLRVEFSANSDFETTTILPVGSQIDKIRIDRTGGLTNGIDPLTFKINGTTPVVLATQGIEFDNSAGGVTYNFLENDIDIILASGEEGTFMAEWAGAGFGTGTGYAYLFYWTPKP